MALTFFQSLKQKKISLSKTLGFPIKLKIPLSLLRKIVNNKVGVIIDNPVKRGRRKIKISVLLKSKARSTITYYKFLDRLKNKKIKVKKTKKKNGRRQ